jgi:hypothetical protein
VVVSIFRKSAVCCAAVFRSCIAWCSSLPG